VTIVDEPLYAGANGALQLALDMPGEYWQQLRSARFLTVDHRRRPAKAGLFRPVSSLDRELLYSVPWHADSMVTHTSFG